MTSAVHTGSGPPAIDVDDLHVTYDGPAGPVHAVRGVSFSVAPGEVFGIVGGSGSGKSSVLNALLGLHGDRTTVAATTLSLGGTDLRALDDAGWRALRGRRMALIPQHPMTALAPTTPVGRQLDWYLGEDALTRHGDDLARLGLDAVLERPGDLPSSFSGGQLQRLVIAIATFGSRPEVLLADEPTSTLDATVQSAVLEVLAEQRARLRSAMVYVSHDLALVAQVCDRVGVVHRGELVEVAPASDLFREPEHPFTRALVDAAAPRTTARRRPPAEPITASGPAEAATAAAPPLLAVDRLYHYFGGRAHARGPVSSRVVRAVDDVSLRVEAGQVLAIVGESGSGKTTLARAVAGAISPTAGTIAFDGRELVGPRAPDDRRRIQLVAQNSRSALNRRRSVGHALDQAQRVHGIGAGRVDRRERSVEMLERVGLSPDHLRRRPARLSGGELARVVLARSLLLSPRLLLLDEPTASLDAQVKGQVLDLLAELRSLLDLTIVVITHELPTARALADDTAVMQAGCLVEHGPTAQVLTAPEAAYTRTLLASEPRPPT